MSRKKAPLEVVRVVRAHTVDDREVGAQQVIERADDRARAAERRADEATRLEGARRGALGEARAALDVVEKHQANARARDEREAAARLDEAAEDAFAARFRVRT
ncbi:MAG: hypothetical protein HYV09_25890 [Deltaproteobacteria bacterium]|nr:hypothetical protein [Deltaproteobacteria bacterium]